MCQGRHRVIIEEVFVKDGAFAQNLLTIESMEPQIIVPKENEPELDPGHFNHHPAPDTPEKELLRAVVEVALRDMRNANPIERDDAIRWLTGTTADQEELSFETVCDYLDIDGQRLLQRVGLDARALAA